MRGSFGLARVGGQWRISSLPKGFGLWLSQYDMERIYRPFSISYVDPVERTLVADRRWFPVTAGLATTLARAQLDPVPDYLQGAVPTGVPLGTAADGGGRAGAVGRATVDLTVRRSPRTPCCAGRCGRSSSPRCCRSSSRPCNEVSLRVDGAQLDLPGLGESCRRWPTWTTARPPPPCRRWPLLRKGSTLTRVDPDGFGDDSPPRRSPDTSAAPLPRIQPGWIELAQSRDGKELAAVGGDRRDLSRWRGTSSHQLPAFGDKLTKPSYDGRDGLWVAGERDGAPRLWVIDTSSSSLAAGPAPGGRHQPAGRPQDRVVPGGRGRPAGGRWSPPGRTAATCSSRSPASSAPPNGTAQSLAAPLRLGWTLTSASSAVWVDDDTVAVIGRVGRAEPQRPYLVDIGGPATGLHRCPTRGR